MLALFCFSLHLVFSPLEDFGDPEVQQVTRTCKESSLVGYLRRCLQITGVRLFCLPCGSLSCASDHTRLDNPVTNDCVPCRFSFLSSSLFPPVEHF